MERLFGVLFPGDPELILIVNPDAAAREGAERENSSYSFELALYLVHGMLHAAGEDDLAEETARSMRAAEKRVRDQLVKEFDLAALFPESR